MAARPCGSAKPVKHAQIVLVSGKLQAGQLHKAFIPNFKPLAAHVAQHEDGCLAYELSVAEDNSDKLLIYERYTNNEYLEKVHWQSEPYKAFGAANREAGIEWVDGSKQVVRYVEQDVGFADQGSRAFGDSKPVKGAYVLLVTGKTRPGQVHSKFIPLFKPLAEYVAQNEDGTLAYELSVAQDEPDRIIIYERYISKDYLETVHKQSKAYQAFMHGILSGEVEWDGNGLELTGYIEQDIGF